MTAEELAGRAWTAEEVKMVLRAYAGRQHGASGVISVVFREPSGEVAEFMLSRPAASAEACPSGPESRPAPDPSR